MRVSITATTAALVLVVTVVAVGVWSQRDRRNGPASGTPILPEHDRAMTPARAASLRDTIAAVPIQWTVSEVLERMRLAGIQAAVQADVMQPFLAVPGAVVRLEGAEIQLYLYGDAGAAGRDVARLDTSRVAPPEMMITWIAPPSLIWHNNLVAIVLTRDETLRGRIRHALEPRQEIEDSP